MKFKKSLLILLIPAVLVACEQEAYAPEVKEDISLVQEIENPAENTQKEQEAKERAEKQQEEAAAQAAEEDQERIQGYKEEAFLEQIRESMVGVANIEFSQAEKTYYLYPIDPMIIDEIHNLIMYGQGLEDWNYMVESLVVLSEAAQQVVGDGYTIMFMNPANGDNTLVVVKDGQAIYNAANDL